MAVDSGEQFMSVAEIAATLNCHPQTVHSLIKRGELEAIKIGRDYRVSLKDFRGFLEAQRVAQNNRRAAS